MGSCPSTAGPARARPDQDRHRREDTRVQTSPKETGARASSFPRALDMARPHYPLTRYPHSRWPCSRRCSRTIGAAQAGRSRERRTSSACPSAPTASSRPGNAHRTGRRFDRICKTFGWPQSSPTDASAELIRGGGIILAWITRKKSTPSPSCSLVHGRPRWITRRRPRWDDNCRLRDCVQRRLLGVR